MANPKIMLAALGLVCAGALAACDANPPAANEQAALAVTGTDPTADASVPAPLPMIHVMFNGKIDSKVSGVEVATADGKPVEMGEVMPLGDSMLMATPKTPLPAGQYRVKWHAAGADAKTIQGEFAFTVQP